MKNKVKLVNVKIPEKQSMNTREFYNTTITVEVLSLEPIPDKMSLEAISTNGHWPMSNPKRSQLRMTEQEMRKELTSLGHDPNFFGPR
jgi:hypothetical protein